MDTRIDPLDGCPAPGGQTPADPLNACMYAKTPDDSTDDRWACYTRIKPPTPPNPLTPSSLVSCIKPYMNAGAVIPPSACAVGDSYYTVLGLVTDDTFNDLDPDPNKDTSPQFIINENLPTTGLAFAVTLRSLYNPLALEDRSNNPKIEMASRVAPDGHSF